MWDTYRILPWSVIQISLHQLFTTSIKNTFRLVFADDKNLFYSKANNKTSSVLYMENCETSVNGLTVINNLWILIKINHSFSSMPTQWHMILLSYQNSKWKIFQQEENITWDFKVITIWHGINSSNLPKTKIEKVLVP